MRHTGKTLTTLGLACLLFASGGCVALKKQESPVRVTHAAYIDVQLRNASESISHDLATLTGSTQNRDYHDPPGAGDLYAHMDLHWDGPIEGALARVASHAGYKLQVDGEAPKVPVNVHINIKDRPCLAIFREIGLQTGPREGVHVDENLRLVTLRYLGEDK